MCGASIQLGCTKTLEQIWTGISEPKHNTKRFIVIRNDQVIYDRGEPGPYPSYSASKGLLGAPALVYAMSKCGVGLGDRVSGWLGHGSGARWKSEYPWTDITVEHLATHTSGVCDYANPSAACQDGSPDWQRAYDVAERGGEEHAYPDDAFTIARLQSELNSEPALPPGSVYEYSNVGHALLNYAVQRACGESLADIFDLHIKQPGMGSPVRPALIHTDEGQQFNQSAGSRDVGRTGRRGGAAAGRQARHLEQPERGAGAVLARGDQNRREPPGSGVRQSRRDLREQLVGHLDPVSGPQAAIAGDVRSRRQLQHGFPYRSFDFYDRGTAGREQRDRRVVPHDQRVRARLDRNGAELRGRAPTGATTGTWPAASSAPPVSGPES